MPTVRAVRSVARSRDAAWAFVEDLDNWAPLLGGYLAHERTSPTRSVWTLTGDLGPFSRTVQLEVQVTEQVDGERVVFTLTGLDEAVHGGGDFAITEDRPELPPLPLWRRLWAWLRGGAPRPVDGTTHVVFTFAIEADGPMAPLLNPMLGPVAERVAQDLLDAVGARLEAS